MRRYKCRCCNTIDSLQTARIRYNHELESFNKEFPDQIFWIGKRNHKFWEGGFRDFLFNEYEELK